MSPSALPAFVASRAGSVTESLKKNLRRSSSPKTDPGHDGDNASIKSRSSQLLTESSPIDTLLILAGERVRRGNCSPEFLEGMAERGGDKYVKILTGGEAEVFFKKYVEEEEELENKSLRGELDKETRQDWTPVVFATTAWDVQGKAVDYYRTWRGTAGRTRGLNARKISLLEDEFRRVAKRLDRHYKLFPSITGDATPRQTPEKNGGRKSRPPTEILVSAAEKSISDPNAPKHLSIPEPPTSATDSVISLPYLNLVRGVPVGHRLPLRITNPDRNSMLSNSGTAPLANAALGIVKEGVETVQPQVELLINTAVPAVVHQAQPSGLTPLMKSSASITSAITRFGRSSSSSRSTYRERRQFDSQSRPTSRERDRDSSNKRRRRSSSPKDGDRDNDYHHSSRRRSDKNFPEDEDVVEFLIVLLDENFAHRGETWHGLERQVSMKNQITSQYDRHSPWSGPLARSDTISYRHAPQHTSEFDEDSENSDDEPPSEVGGWQDSPVVPTKPLMEAMGLVPRESYYQPPVTPYQVSIAGSTHTATPVLPRGSPFPYTSPRISASSYVPAWISPASSHHPSLPVSRPQSRAFSVYSPYTPPF